MQFKALLASTSLVGVLAWMPLVSAQAQTAGALSAKVSSAEEGSMEGVLVSAKKVGSTITVTVVTDAKGQYSFPADRLDAGHYGITIRAAGYNLDGPKAVDIASGGSTANIPSLEVDYGVLSNLEATILIPLGLSQVSGVGTNVGFGDVELSLKYRFIEEDSWGWRPAVAFAPQINLPSGSEARGLGAGRTTGFIPIWASKDINQWTVFGGGGLNINTGPDQKNWWFSGVGVLRELDPNWTVGGELYYSSPDATGVKHTMGFNLGFIYNINDIYHVLLSAGRNLINARDTNQFSTYIGMQFTF